MLETYNSDALRLYLLSNHYRSAWEFEDEALDTWSGVAGTLQEAFEVTESGLSDVLDVSRMRDRFIAALEDDLDTPRAITVLQEIAQAILEAPEDDDITEAQRTLQDLGDLLGLTLSSN